MFGMGKSKHWVMLANYNDIAQMRNKLAYDFANEIGSLGMDSTWVQCVLNGEFTGTYQFCEHVRVGSGRVEIFDWEDAVADKTDLSGIDPEVEDISGGYLFEFSSEMDELTKFTTKSGYLSLPTMVNSPEYLYTNPAMLQYCKDFLQNYWDACTSADRRSKEGRHYSEYCDVDSMVHFFLVEELFADSLSDCTVARWDRRTDSVAAVRRRMLGHVVLRERPDPSPDPGAVAAALMEGVRAKGAANLPCWTPEALRLRSRMQFLHRTMPQAGWPDVSDAAIDAAPEKFLAGFADGFSRWAHFRDLDMARVLQAAAAAAGADLRGIDRLAPARIEMPSGSAIAVDYDGDEPSVAVRLQETFGMRETPRVAGGAVPVLMKLLSPSMRPVQITKDMANFWREGYALVRKEMRGRYPKHYWPEDPLEATPTRRVRPR